MFKFKFDKKTKEQKIWENKVKLEKEYKKRYGHGIITRLL